MKKNHVLWTIFLYESKLVRRNRLFQLFVGGMLLILGLLIPWDIGRVRWENVVFSSSIFLRGIYLLNLLQSVVIAFMICDIQRMRDNAETREVLWERPVSNGVMFLGEFLGIFVPFICVNIVFALLSMLGSMSVPNFQVNIGLYLFYLLAQVLPVLVFAIGLSLLVAKSFRHVLLRWLILFVFLGGMYVCLREPFYGILDVWGRMLPNTFSSMIGFMHLPDYLLQRGVFLFLGIGILAIDALFVKRTFEVSSGQRYWFITAFGCLIITLGLAFVYIGKFETRKTNRRAYRKAFIEYGKYPKASVMKHDITYTSNGDQFLAASEMRIQNKKSVRLEKLVLFLNPGLEVRKIECDGKDVSFYRKHQVLVAEQVLNPGEHVVLKVEYAGTIDEDVYQINVSDDDFFAFAAWRSGENYGKRMAFVSDEYTLLIPQLLWYPVTIPAVALEASGAVNFTDYSLYVKDKKGMTVLSQGESTRESAGIRFRNFQNLTGLTLCIGKYEKRTITVDSLTVEFYTYPGNDFYLNYFDEWDFLKNGDSNENLAKIFKQCRESVEKGKSNAYPFRYFKLIEVPSSFYFLRTAAFSDNAQPEIVLFPERLCGVANSHPGTYRGDKNKEETVQDFMLSYMIPFLLEQVNVRYVFSNYNSCVFSDKYQGIDVIFKLMTEMKEFREEVTPELLACVAEKGLEGIVAEKYSKEQTIAMYLKVSQFLGYLTTITSWDSLHAFMNEFKEQARFNDIDFDLFLDGFEQRFGVNIKDYMHEWYTSRQIPALEIKDLACSLTDEMQIIDFKVGNSGKIDGVVSFITPDGGYIGGKQIRFCKSYLIKPGEYKRIVFKYDIDEPLLLTTNFSRNLPQSISFENEGVFIDDSGPEAGITCLDEEQFHPLKEIIVDNEDENFHLISAENERKRLVDLMQKGDSLTYTYANSFKTSTWSLPISQEFYGDYIHGAFVKKMGTGKFKAEWRADIKESGEYEIFIYRPHIVVFGEEKCATDYPGMQNYYTIYTPEGSEEVVLEISDSGEWVRSAFMLPMEDVWVSLGRFNLQPGVSRVVLDDRGVMIQDKEYENQYFTQLIVADAVKWVKKN